MNPSRTNTRFRHAPSSRLPRVAVVSGVFLAIAAATGVTLAQLDSPQPAHASPAAAVMSLPRATTGSASRSQMRTAPQAAPATPAPASTPPAPPTKVLNYTFQLQDTYYNCGPAATRIVLSTTGHLLSQQELGQQLHTTTAGTDSALDTTRVLNSVLGRNAYQTRAIPGPAATPAQMDQLQADVVRAVNDGRGLVANIVHSVTDTNGVTHTYDGGHFLAIVGYDDSGRLVKVADNADPNGDGTYWVTTINMANWIAGHGYSY